MSRKSKGTFTCKIVAQNERGMLGQVRDSVYRGVKYCGEDGQVEKTFCFPRKLAEEKWLEWLDADLTEDELRILEPLNRKQRRVAKSRSRQSHLPSRSLRNLSHCMKSNLHRKTYRSMKGITSYPFPKQCAWMAWTHRVQRSSRSPGATVRLRWRCSTTAPASPSRQPASEAHWTQHWTLCVGGQPSLHAT